MRKRALGIVAASAFAVAALGRPASADVGDPGLGEPGCHGRIVGLFNQFSGQKADEARGPGFFFHDGQIVKVEITGARTLC